VPNVKKIRGLKLPGTPWANSACCGRPLPFVHVLTLQKPQIPPRFNVCSVINKCTKALILGLFIEFQKATVSFTMSVHLSTWNNPAPTVWISIKLNVWIFFENPFRKFKFRYTQTIIRGTLREQQYTLSITSCSVLLRMRNISEKHCRENQNTHFVFSNCFFIFLKSGPLWDNVEKYCRAGHRWQYGARTLHVGYLKLQIHTQNM
jgi:hypothetical protein